MEKDKVRVTVDFGRALYVKMRRYVLAQEEQSKEKIGIANFIRDLVAERIGRGEKQ